MSRFPGNIIKLPNVTPTQSSASGVWSLKDQMVYQRNNLWPFQRDPYFNYTTLLLQGNVPNTTGPQAMNLPLSYNADASTNNFLVTPNGDVGPRPFSPYFGGNYSSFFNALTDGISAPGGTAFALGTADFTVECWIYPTTSSDNQNIMTMSESGNNYFLLGINTATVKQPFMLVGGTQYLGPATLNMNAWNHIAAVKRSNSITVFTNGVAGSSASNTTDLNRTNLAFIVGRAWGTGGGNYYGYVSNARLVKGTAVYTSNFTPPIDPLQNISGTSLLACQANRFIDNSTANSGAGWALTVTGTPRITDNSPFVSTDFTTGAGYFDGNGDYLSAAANSVFDITGDFTVDSWIYLTADPATNGSGNKLAAIAGYSNGSTSNAGWELYVNFTGNTLSMTSWGTVNAATCSFTPVKNTWYHIAITKSGSTSSIFVNGVSQTLTVNALTINAGSSPTLNIGRSSGASSYEAYFPGYISNFRLIKGVAVYTGNFSPPSLANLGRSGATSIAAYPSTTNVNTSFAESATSLLTLQTRAPSQNINFIDSSPNEFIVTKNGNTTQGTFSPFSPTGWGNYFNGSTDYLSLSDNAAWNMGSGDFTAECWIYPTSFANQGMILGQWSGDVGGTGLNWALMFDSGGSGYLRFLTSSNGSGVLFDLSTSTTSFTLTLNTWQHIAGVRNGNTFTIYVNGVSRATTTSASSLYDATNNFTIGAESSTTAQYFTGYISNIRLIKGQALATGNFTPPTALASSTVVGWTGTNVPTQSITGTVSLLTCQSNRFVDNGPNNFTITRNGSPSVQAFSPFAPANAVSPLVTGGSGYFDGGASSSSDYLNVTSSSLYRIEVNTTWTIECWVYALSLASTPVLITNTTNGASTGHSLYLNAGVPTLTQFGNAAFASTATINANAWNHIAVVCNSNSGTFYVNGSTAGTFTWGSGSAGGPLFVGAGYTGSNTLNGYISGVRYVVGSIVVPAGVPTTPPTAIPNTSLLLNFTNGAAVDATGKGIAETIAGTQLTVTKATNNYLTGGASVKMTGSGDYIKYAPSVLHDIAGGDFVIEGWFYFTDLSADRAMVSKYGNSSETGGGLGYVLQWFQSGSALRFVLGNSSGDQLYTWSWSPSINTWYYVAVSRNGTNGRAYVGTSGTANQIGSTLTLVTNDLVSPNSLQVGKTHTVAQYLLGYTSSIRITKGSARGYTGSTISIPTGPFPIG
jgi:hypothetical protein